MARARQNLGSKPMADTTTDSQTAAEEVEAVTATAVEQTQAVVEQTKTVSAKAIDQTVAAMKDTVNKAASRVEASQSQVKEGITKSMKTAEEVVAFSQGNVEALIKSGQIWSTGLQDLSKQMVTSIQASYEEAVSAFKALTSVKSLKEAVDLQVGLARSAVEKGVTESSKYTDASFKLAEQALAPISSRVTLAVEKFSKPV
jgi:phasin family protein